MTPIPLRATALLIVLSCCLTPAFAAPPRVLPDGETPNDSRLDPLKDLNGYFPFHPPLSKKEWNRRAANLRRRVLVSQGLWPLPRKHPLKTVIHGKLDRGDYTVEKVYFESLPGFYVTGSLYRPQGGNGKRPGVLSPHGHWSNGRFYDAGEGALAKLKPSGAEQFDAAARSHLQARCVHLARMGCVVFHYDMIGYADCQQISFQIAHRFAKQRSEMNSATRWGLFSPQAESRFQSVMGLQTYNSIRALDFLESLPDVDSKRLAVTGASGGGTQTFMLCAVDPRPAAALPAVMVSTAMQGGCTCENACGLRVAMGNVELAALFAPKPLCLTAADDWTKEMETKGFPELRRHYEVLGAPDNVRLMAAVRFGHNYNAVSRQALYEWFNEHLNLRAKSLDERPFERLTTDQMTVWDEQHPRPRGGDEFEVALLQHWEQDSRKQLAAAAPRDANSARGYREIVGGGIDAVIGRRLPRPAEVDYEQTDKGEVGNYVRIVGLLRNLTHQEELPVVFLYPKAWENRVVIWLDGRGKAGMYGDDGKPIPAVKKLLDQGVAVAGVDLFMQGEFLKDGKPVERTRRVGNPREAAAYSFGYNPTLFARRVHDALTAIAFVRAHEYTPEHVDIVVVNGAGPIGAAARAQARDAIDRAAIVTAKFRFAQVESIHSPNFLPGGAKYDDLPGMLAVAAPSAVWIGGEDEVPHVTAAAYKATGGKASLGREEGDKAIDEAVEWIVAGAQ